MMSADVSRSDWQPCARGTLAVAQWGRATRSMIDGIELIERINRRGSLLKVLDNHIWI
jgi:hypothetical protein